MLRIAVVCILLCSLLAVPVQAQEGRWLQDDAGDLTSTGIVPTTTPSPESIIDLRGMDVEETARDITFVLEVDDLPESDDADDRATYFLIHFSMGAEQYQVHILRSYFAGIQDVEVFELRKYDPARDRYVDHLELEGATDASEDTFTVSVPRDALRDENGAPPAPERQLSDLFVSSYDAGIGSICIVECTQLAGAEDRMPDEGMVTYDIIKGVVQSGHARLHSDEPFRASNGEASTFVVHVEARNTGDKDDRFRFEAIGAPSQWGVKLPQTIKIPAGATVELPIVINTAFAHAHGSATSFLVEMVSQTDPDAIGRLEVGIFYPDPAQPAGHHDTLYVHSTDQRENPFMFLIGTAVHTALANQGLLEDGYMNTMEEDERADEVPIEPDGECQVQLFETDYPVGSTFCWEIPLQSQLLLGLDFDLSRKGTLEATFRSDLPMPQTTLTGQLAYVHPSDDEDEPFFMRDQTLLANFTRSDPQEIAASSSKTFTLDVSPTPDADLVAYQPGATLLLRLELTTLRPSNFFLGPDTPPPTLTPGASLQLPLDEYADPVEQVLDFGDRLLLSPVTEQERLVNPGETVLFKARLSNEGDDDTVGVTLIGSNADWATVMGPDEFKLASGETRDITIAVAAPGGASAGDKADLVIEAASRIDVASRAMLRTVATVVVDTDVPDEAEQAAVLSADGDKKSPGPGGLLALSLALAAVAARRPGRR